MSIVEYLNDTWEEPKAVSELGKNSIPPLPIPWLLHVNFDIKAIDVLCFIKILYPDFVEHDGGVFLECHFTKECYNEWNKDKKLSLSDIEMVINHAHMTDIFMYDDKSDYKDFLQVANLLKETWRFCLERKFPEKKFLLNVNGEEDDCDVVLSFKTVRDD